MNFRNHGRARQEYSDLLEESGVDTIVELAKRIPDNLHAKMHEVNEKKTCQQVSISQRYETLDWASEKTQQSRWILITFQHFRANRDY